jgi:DNA-binding response OmpR family regulator
MGVSWRILAVDDDDTSLKIITNALAKEGYDVVALNSAAEAFGEFQRSAARGDSFDLVLSDYFMPGMAGDELLRKVRKRDQYVAFVFLTANTNVEVAIELVKSGADDHIVKPIVAEELLFRVEKNIKEKNHLRIIEKTERERDLIQLEKEKLVNWRALYAAKDITQTEQMIGLLSRTINQSGGFLWVDLLESGVEQLPDGAFKVDKALVEMILTSGRVQKNIFDYITFIGDLDSLELQQEGMPAADLVGEIASYLQDEAESLTTTYPRSYLPMIPDRHEQAEVSVDLRYLKKVVRELLINAIKYSPRESRIVLSFDYNSGASGRALDISIRNKPDKHQAKDVQGQPIVGVPYDYSELVFDLFYTIDGFPTHMPEEEWSDGTGLYVARKLIRKHGGWIRSNNGVDYTGETPETFVKFTVTLPLTQPVGA